LAIIIIMYFPEIKIGKQKYASLFYKITFKRILAVMQ